MRKIALFVLIALAFSTSAWALPAPDSSKINFILGEKIGGNREVPNCTIIPVRLSLMGANLTGINSGEVVYWDTNSADGISINKDASLTPGNANFAGVAVTAIQTADSAATNPNNRNWGWIAIKGVCVASIDGTITAGDPLASSGTFEGSFGYAGTTTSSADAIAVTSGTVGQKILVDLK